MADHNDLPLFNLKAVVTETGLKPDTLRAWERRYGIPAPKRTPSGHRLYSQSDIDLLHWLIARQEEGLSISRAVEMWERLAAKSDAPANMQVSALQLPQTHPASRRQEDVLSALRERWIAACMRYEEVAAEQVLSESFALFTPEVVCIDIIQRGLATIGEGWYMGRVTVQQEHFASSLAMRRLDTMLLATPPPTRAGRIIIGCPPEEEHTFVPLLLSLLLRRRGWDTIYLGANVPLESLEATIAATRPQLVVLTAQQLATAAGVMEMGAVLMRARVALAYGGLVFARLPQLRDAIPGHYLGGRIEAATAAIEQLMVAPRILPARAVASVEYMAALAHFKEHQPAIEADIWQKIHGHTIPPRMLTAANYHLGRNIEASLALGNMQYIDSDLDWLEGLLTSHVGMPMELLDQYLLVYLHALESTLDSRGALIVQWLDGVVKGDHSQRRAVQLSHRNAVTR